MKIKAVIDRIDGDKVVILTGPEQDRLIIFKSQLPPGAKEGDWLITEIEDDHVFSVKSDPEETSSAKSRISEKLNQLRRG
jgi:hypothetical protein